MDRRQFAAFSGAALFAPVIPMRSGQVQVDTWRGERVRASAPIEIAMLMFPNMYALDLFGPYELLSSLPNARIHLLSKTLDPVTAEKGVRILPTATLADCPRNLDVLFSPGGTLGVNSVMKDDVMLDFVADRGATAKYVTSVCTGALILGAAGLLRGFRAATHWAAMNILPCFGAIPTHERVVQDRNRMTGGGVTAGIDFGLSLVANLCGDDYAKLLQLVMEYDPHPPFHSGSPKEASPALVTHYAAITADIHEVSRVRAEDPVIRRGL